MKKAFISILLLFVVGITFGQVIDTIPVIHTTGEAISTFLKNNAWNLALIVFLLLSEWLGTTGKVKEGSIYAWIINMIGKIIRSKTDLVSTRKAKFMDEDTLKAIRGAKILVFALLLSGMGLTVGAQGRWDGFLKPVSSNAQFLKGPGEKSYEFKFRPAAEMTAVQILYDKETKLWTSSTFHSAGLGLGLQHYVEGTEGPVNNYGFNALLMLDATPTEDKGAGFGVAATMNIPHFVTFGGGYNFTFKKPYVLLGAVYNF